MPLSREEALKMLDDLFAEPNAPKKNPAPAKKPASAKPTPIEESINELAARVWRAPRKLSPRYIIWEVVHQKCAGCGEVHTFIRNRLVRFEGDRSPLHTALEIPVSTPDTLPQKADHIWETVPVCPTCIAIAEACDGFFAPAKPVQLPMFN